MFAYLGLGTNLGDRISHLRQTITLLSTTIGQIEAESNVYESAPMYITQQPPFLNMVVRIETPLVPLELLHSIKAIEVQMGRNTEPDSQRYGPRPIDIDIELLTNAAYPQQASDWLIFDAPDLHIPHLLLPERAFVLLPLQDVLPATTTFIHPRTQESLATMLANVARQECQNIGTLGDE